MGLKDERTVKQEVRYVLDLMANSNTRSQIWDALYETEYECESMELNEAMASMTDEQVEKWFPEVLTEYLVKKLDDIANNIIKCPECKAVLDEDAHYCDCGWTDTNDLTCNFCASDVDLCECAEGQKERAND